MIPKTTMNDITLMDDEQISQIWTYGTYVSESPLNFYSALNSKRKLIDILLNVYIPNVKLYALL